jgi:hypothetical protein
VIGKKGLVVKRVGGWWEKNNFVTCHLSLATRHPSLTNPRYNISRSLSQSFQLVV